MLGNPRAGPVVRRSAALWQALLVHPLQPCTQLKCWSSACKKPTRSRWSSLGPAHWLCALLEWVDWESTLRRSSCLCQEEGHFQAWPMQGGASGHLPLHLLKPLFFIPLLSSLVVVARWLPGKPT